MGPPIPDIPRFTVDGQRQTIVDWWDQLEAGQCEDLVRDTTVYTADSDNARATHALAFLYRGAAHACLQEWRLAANNLAAAAACQDDLTSIGNSDQEQPLELLDRAIRYVEDHGTQVGDMNSSVCYSEPPESPTITPTGTQTHEASPTDTSTP